MRIPGNVQKVCQFIGQHIVESNVCVETGCICTDDQGNRFDTTTNNIMEFICVPKSGTLYSFDNDPAHIEVARNYSSVNDKVRFVLGDSVEGMKNLADAGIVVDLLCLDSLDGTEDHMVNEFLAAQGNLAEKHYVLVDDIHNPGSVKYKKTVPLLKDLGYDWIEVSTPTGMFVAAKGYSIPTVL